MPVANMAIIDEREKSILCRVAWNETPFWMPKAHTRILEEGKLEFPEWLLLEHRQLCGDEAFDAHKTAKKQAKAWSKQYVQQ